MVERAPLGIRGRGARVATPVMDIFLSVTRQRPCTCSPTVVLQVERVRKRITKK